MKKALCINAAFSGISGIALIAFQNQFAILFELETTTPFWVIGVALVFFSLSILYEVKKQNRARIIWIITQDMLWVIGSIYMLIANPFAISKGGNFAIAIVALVVLAMAVTQARAFSKLEK